LRLQARFKHLFSRPDGEALIAEIQTVADRNV
jgi:hypothetical protein